MTFFYFQKISFMFLLTKINKKYIIKITETNKNNKKRTKRRLVW
jgi:hypothetical protein